MRFDIVFYLFGIVCFALAVMMIPLFGVGLLPVAFLIVALLFGLLFMAFGYSARPRKYTRPLPPRKPSTEARPEEKPTQPSPQTPPTAPLPEAGKPATALTIIKGIGPKRIAQLKNLQINSVEDLTGFSAEDLADKLGISSKITAKWLEQAQASLREKA